MHILFAQQKNLFEQLLKENKDKYVPIFLRQIMAETFEDEFKKILKKIIKDSPQGIIYCFLDNRQSNKQLLSFSPEEIKIIINNYVNSNEFNNFKVNKILLEKRYFKNYTLSSEQLQKIKEKQSVSCKPLVPPVNLIFDSSNSSRISFKNEELYYYTPQTEIEFFKINDIDLIQMITCSFSRITVLPYDLSVKRNYIYNFECDSYASCKEYDKQIIFNHFYKLLKEKNNPLEKILEQTVNVQLEKIFSISGFYIEMPKGETLSYEQKCQLLFL